MEHKMLHSGCVIQTEGIDADQRSQDFDSFSLTFLMRICSEKWSALDEGKFP